MEPTSTGQARTYLSLAWFACAAAYAGYAAYTYSGLFQLACDWQDHIFGAHETSVSFIVTVLLCAIPAFLISPRLWKRNGITATLGTPVPVRTPQEGLALARRTMLIAAAVAALVSLGTGLLAWRQAHHIPVVAQVDLLNGAAAPDLAHADQVVMHGLEHPEVASQLTTTTNGTRSIDLYTPFTGPGWKRDQTIDYVIKEGLDPGTINGLARSGPVSFGPALMEHGSLPGEIRTAWQRSGLKLSPKLLVLNPQTGDATTTLNVICFIAGLVVLSMITMAVMMPWAVRRAALRNQALR